MSENPRTAVLVAAHGSRVAESNSEVARLAARLADTMSRDHPVSHAFLEMADPSIPDAIDDLVRSGATRVVVIPYFLSAGRHVVEDIPALIEEARTRHPGVRVELTRHFGAEDGVPALLSQMVEAGSGR